MGWNNIVIEGFCFAPVKDGKYLCGQNYPTVDCLRNGICPCLMYSESSEREAAYFIPLRKIIWDRISSVIDDIKTNIWYYTHKHPAIKFDTVTSKECTELKEWEEYTDTREEEYKKWAAKGD